MTHYEEMYKALLPIHEATVKQYEAVIKWNDDLINLLTSLGNENLLLREKLDNVRKLLEKYENETNKKGAWSFTLLLFA